MAKPTRWISAVPKCCEICKAPIVFEFVDGKTFAGPWALMCNRCHTEGPGINRLGLGLGQKYVLQSDGTWISQGNLD